MKTAQKLQQSDESLPTDAASIEPTSDCAGHSPAAVRDIDAKIFSMRAARSAILPALLADASRAAARYVEEYSAARGAE